MPNNTAFDNQIGTTNITGTQTIHLENFAKLSLSANKTITFNGPGNYIFYEVDNALNTNKLVFDFKNTTTGTINIFIIKDAKWGRLSVSTKNGNFPSRIYTEIHGTGAANEGNTFNIIGPQTIPTGSHVWLGNVWAPNGGISVKSLSVFNAPHIIGALWSAKKVELDQKLKLVYQAPAVGTVPGFVQPYFTPPANGKVSTANNNIGAELVALSQNPGPITSIPENEIFVIDNNARVMIEVVSKEANDATLRAQLISLGMRNARGLQAQLIMVRIFIRSAAFSQLTAIPQLNSNTRIELCPSAISTYFQYRYRNFTGRYYHAFRCREIEIWLDGSGVKIGVISDSYNAKQGAQTDVNEGDLPGVKSNGQPNENPDPVQVVGRPDSPGQ